MKSILIIGGARSGKSQRAEQLTSLWPPGQKIYIATWRRDLNPTDKEMELRIQNHHQRRGNDWKVHEAQGDLPACLEKFDSPESWVLIDCVTMWLSGIIMEGSHHLKESTDHFIERVECFSGHLIMVANEVGGGLVPPDASSRLFRDWNGRLNRELARVVQTVELVTAGLVQVIKGP